MNDNATKDINSWGLKTKDAHGLYEKFGFSVTNTPYNIMIKKMNHKL